MCIRDSQYPGRDVRLENRRIFRVLRETHFPWSVLKGKTGFGLLSARRDQRRRRHGRKDPISKNLEKSSTFCEKSFVSSTPGSFIRPRWLLTEKYTEGLHPERPARGAVLYTGQSRPCIEHKGPPSTKKMHTKDGHDSRGRNYKAETQLPTFAWASLPI